MYHLHICLICISCLRLYLGRTLVAYKNSSAALRSCESTSSSNCFFIDAYLLIRSVTPQSTLTTATMPTSEWDSSFYWSHWRSASGAEVHGKETEPDRFSFLSFLATAQALQVDFLPLVWDAERGVVGTGGSSRIHQSLVDLDTSLAFKTYHKQTRTEEQIFRTVINEITVLNQPSVREHTNIARLQGICWDISPRDDKPWPVLVFEKSHFGDMDHFARHGGRNMKPEERLSLCLDVGRAIMDMHANCR